MMLRLVQSAGDNAHPATENRIAVEYQRSKAYRTIDRLIDRVLQLDTILHQRCTFRPEKADRVKQHLERAQDELERAYTQIDDGKARRATMRRVHSAP